MQKALVSFALLLGLTGCKGPQGDVGPMGEPGMQGPKGDPGTSGSADGGSGYSPYGNGSAGAFHDTNGTPAVLDGLNFQYTDFTVDDAVSINFAGGFVIRCTGTFTLNGTINVIASAWSGSSGINGVPSQVFPDLTLPQE